MGDEQHDLGRGRGVKRRVSSGGKMDLRCEAAELRGQPGIPHAVQCSACRHAVLALCAAHRQVADDGDLQQRNLKVVLQEPKEIPAASSACRVKRCHWMLGKL